MKINRWIILGLLLSFVATGMIYPYLPDRIPSHWNIQEEIDGYYHKMGVWFTALLPFLIYILMVCLPKIDPKKDAYLQHQKAYDIIKTAIIVLLILMHWATILVSLGYAIRVVLMVRFAIGILLMIIGKYMAQIQPNYFFGIRTPWTLANDEVWKRTHQVGKYAFIVAGMFTLFTLPLKGLPAFFIMLGSIFIAVIYVFLYSYVVYKKIEKESNQ
jgi:uncharacterized membrane protein